MGTNQWPDKEAPEQRPQDGTIPAKNTEKYIPYYQVKQNPFSVNHKLEAEEQGDKGNTFNKMHAFTYCLPKAGMSENNENKVCEMMANSA